MNYLSEVKRELQAKDKLDNLTKNSVRVLEQAYVKDNPVCKCGNTKNLTYDHIIPRSILINFNIDYNKEFWKENSQTLCHACNQMKQNNLDFSNPKTKTLLIELLERI